MCFLRLLAALASITATTAQKGLGIFFVEEPQSQLVSPGDEVVLTCATNIIVDHLGWLRDWRPLEPGSDVTTEVQPGRLRIRIGRDPEQYRQQIGEYRCMAWIAPVGLASLPASVQVVHLEPFSARPNTTLVVPPGGSALVQCPPPDGSPPAAVQFYRDREPLPPDGDTHQQLSGGRLWLSRLTAGQAGLYTCSARNSRSGQQVAALFTTRLEVRPGREGQEVDRPPRLAVPPAPVYWAATGDSIRLECVADGWPVPEVSWRRLDGGWSDHYVQRPAGLEIPRLQPADHGQFICQADSSRGTVTAATAVRLTEPPSVETSPSDLEVPEGAAAELRCTGRGQPPPQLQWVLNGRPVLEPELGRPRDGRQLHVQAGLLRFEAVRRQDAGLYQCFGHSDSGHDKAAVLLKVIPRQAVSLDLPPSPAAVPAAPRRTAGRRRSHTHSRAGHVLMVPPGPPSVYPISESSVMLQWDVPANDGLAILFFKIQYRRTPRRHHNWHTVDSDVPGTARSFEVTGLKLGAKYIFRVLAENENKDNKHGPNSRKVKMTHMEEEAKPPGSPIITQHWALSPSAIRCSWTYYNLQAASIEGYFIYYRDTTTAGDYSKVTVLGETTKTHTLTFLQPATTYDIKVQAFNRAGGVSAFSPIVTESTMAAAGAATVRPAEGGSGQLPPGPAVTSSGPDRSRARLYAIVGGVLGGLLLLALIAALVCRCCSRSTDKRQETADESSDCRRKAAALQSPSLSPVPADLTWPAVSEQTALAPSHACQQTAETSFAERSPAARCSVSRPTTARDGTDESVPLNNNKYSGEGGRHDRQPDTEQGFETECLQRSAELDSRAELS